MARLDQRLAEAEAALTTLVDLAGKPILSTIERDGAILRLIYTFESMWKTCQHLLMEREGIAVASPNAAIRVARQVGWLGDDETRAALQLARDRNLSAHMYRSEIGTLLAARLAGYAALLERWLAAMQNRAGDP